MAVRDPEAKRQRLLDAGLAEFAAYGIAGARMDRIAKLAGCSAGLVYTYFGSKDELFEAAFEAIVQRALADIPITPDDLPGYAGRLFDSHDSYPEVVRLVTWYQLERAGSGPPLRAVTEAVTAKTEAIRAAQRAGVVSDRFQPEQIVALVLSLSAMWSSPGPETGATGRDCRGATLTDRAFRRATVVEAVRRLVEP
jgi:AcrR family transcriptional regulator